ncbi:MAG: hypothetical protein R3B48_00475 [Kofleriaceae bacterium]
MKLRALALVAALTALTSLAAPAHAQIAAALGRPLPVGSDPAGTVTVRVVNGDASKPASGVDVTLSINDEPRVARTDASGRATFSGLPAGAAAQVKVVGESGEQASQPFAIPDSGGVRLILSTTGALGGGGGGAATPTAGGAPPPRQRSGSIIANAGAPKDSLAIRLTYDDEADPTPPKDHPVYLVAYSADETISVATQRTNEQGRVTFGGLDVSGGTAYFAMTLLPRGDGYDRLLSRPVIPPGSVGLRMILSAEKRDSGAPAVDDLIELQRLQAATPPGGSVVVEVQGETNAATTVLLRDATSGAELLRAEAAAPAEAAAGAPEASPLATFDASKLPAGQLVYAETERGGQRFRSLPFQLTPERGARAVLLTFSRRVLMQFNMTGDIEEDYLVFRAQLSLSNYSWFPYRAGPDGLLFPLPQGFTGAQVTEEESAEISPVPGKGLLLLRPLPPFGKSFLAGWSMRPGSNEVTFDLALPFGTVQSGFQLRQLPGMSFELPAGVTGKTVTAAQGTYFVLPEISVRPNERMVMTIRGLPSGPLWKLWAPRIIGGLVCAVLLLGLLVAFWPREGADAAAPAAKANEERRAKIETLMAELVELEARPNDARRAEVMAELERLWPEQAAADAGERATS